MRYLPWGIVCVLMGLLAFEHTLLLRRSSESSSIEEETDVDLEDEASLHEGSERDGEEEEEGRDEEDEPQTIGKQGALSSQPGNAPASTIESEWSSSRPYKLDAKLHKFVMFTYEKERVGLCCPFVMMQTANIRHERKRV